METPDPFDLMYRADPYAAYGEIRDQDGAEMGSLKFHTYYRYSDCKAILLDGRWGRGSGTDRMRGQERRGFRRSFLRQDPPEHTRLRRLVSKAFTPQVVASMRPRVQEIADSLLDEIVASGEVDLMTSYAYPFPATVICELLGAPFEDREAFSTWAGTLVEGFDPEHMLSPEQMRKRNAAIRDSRLYFRDLAEKRRADPRDDLLTRLVTVQADGEGLNMEDLLATCVLLLIAGHETTANLIGNATFALMHRPEQMGMLRQMGADVGPEWVDELMRFDGPIQIVSRTALEDLEYSGVKFVKGDTVALVFGSANRDPAACARPDEMDLSRPDVRHLGFGAGIHSCMGAALARLEVEIALLSLLRRCPALRFGASEPVWRHNIVIRGLASFPIAVG